MTAEMRLALRARSHRGTRGQAKSCDLFYVSRSVFNQSASDFSIQTHGQETQGKKECDEQLLAEYAAPMTFYVARAATFSGVALQNGLLPGRFALSDLALPGVHTDKLTRLVAKDRITGIIRARFGNYIRSPEASEVEGEPRGHISNFLHRASVAAREKN